MVFWLGPRDQRISVYISKVEISNFRCFKKGYLILRHPEEHAANGSDIRYPNVNLLLGDNGSGKSSILKALALAIVGPVIRDSGYRPYFLVNRRSLHRATVDAVALLHPQDFGLSSKSAFLVTQRRSRLHAEVIRRGDYESVVSKMPAGASELYLEDSPAFFVAGYGATRRVDEPGQFSSSEIRKSRSGRYQRIAGLFEPQVSLASLTNWLPELQTRNKGRFSQVRRLLNALLPEDVEFTGKIVDRDFAFCFRGQDVPFAALSDGYRAYIGWVCDLLYPRSLDVSFRNEA